MYKFRGGVDLNKTKKSALRVGLICALMMLIIMLPSMIKNHGIYIVRGDYIDQYIPRLYKAKEIMSQGIGTWDWYNLLGAPYSGIKALLSLNSVCLLFPKEFIPYAVTYMHLILFAITGISAFLYFRYMVKEEKHAVIGALLYTFSSYTFINLEFMQFVEGLWAFPLLLLAAEKMFRSENYKHELVIAVFASAVTNFYLFVFSTISFAVYFLCRFFGAEEWRSKRKAVFFFKAVFEYILGFSCALFIAVPYLYKVFASSGSAEKIGSAVNREWLYDGSFFTRFFALVTPAASNRFNVFGFSAWRSVAAYVPVFGVSFGVATLFNKQHKNRGWVIALCVMGAVLMLSSGVSFVYNMFSSTYTRYAYASVLFFVLATVLFMDNYNKRAAKIGVGITLGGFGLLVALYYFCYYYLDTKFGVVNSLVNVAPTEEDVNAGLRLYTIIVAVAFGVCLLGFVFSKRMQKSMLPIIVTVITVYGCTYTAINIKDSHFLDYYRSSSITLSEQVEGYFKNLPEFDNAKDYRIDFPMQFRNYAYVAGKPSITIFESVRNFYADEMLRYMDYSNGKVSVFPQDSDNEIRTLLGVKYYYDLYPEDAVAIPDGFTYKETSNGINVYENENFLGLGFSYGNYITRSELELIDNCDMATLMLNTLIVEDKDEHFVAGLLDKGLSDQAEDRLVFDSFETTSYGFRATVTADKNAVMFVSVPYEKEGWTAYINGKQAEFIQANVGCMAFKVPEGDCTVEFSYKAPADRIGTYGSIVGLLVLILYVVLCSYAKKGTRTLSFHNELDNEKQI